MDNFQINQFLRDLNKQTHRGICISCDKEVGWAKEKVANHKRLRCTNVSEGEKIFFQKRKAVEVTAFLDNSFDDGHISNDVASAYNSDDEKNEEADRLLASFFFRTGISFLLADSESFKAFVSKINPSYAKSIPSAKSLSGVLLDQNYTSEVTKLNAILESSKNLTLISDGWTNLNGEHIVNYSVKAPGHKPLFKRSANTSGIVQIGRAIAEAICEVLEELGAEKFCCVVTDNAAVMRSAWQKIEGRYPHISANGCAAHGMNLLIKDLLSAHDKTISESAKVIKFINNHYIVQETVTSRGYEMV